MCNSPVSCQNLLGPESCFELKSGKIMLASAIDSAWHGGALGPFHPSPLSYQSYSPLLSRPQLYDRTLSWKPMDTRKKVVKLCRLSARANGSVKPYKDSTSVGKVYLDEQDVVTFLDPPNELIPLDPSSYNPASYLWKKIEDIPEERRHNLLSLLNPRLISRAWEVAGRRYDDSKLAKKSSSTMLSDGNSAASLELWKCRTSGAPFQIAWIHNSEKAIFRGKDGKAYGRLIGGGFPLRGSICPPLYFSVRECIEVVSTEEPCDLAYEFGDGLLSLPQYPQGFPKPEKHSWPFDDEVVIYVRHVGPGVMVGEAWQEGKALQQVPKKLCSEMLMVKDYVALDQ